MDEFKKMVGWIILANLQVFSAFMFCLNVIVIVKRYF